MRGWITQLINTLNKHYNDLNDFKKVISKRAINLSNRYTTGICIMIWLIEI